MCSSYVWQVDLLFFLKGVFPEGATRVNQPIRCTQPDLNTFGVCEELGTRKLTSSARTYVESFRNFYCTFVFNVRKAKSLLRCLKEKVFRQMASTHWFGVDQWLEELIKSECISNG